MYPLAYYIIEGVGPSSGFMAPVCRNGCPECGYTLQSFTLNGDTLYHGNCEILAGIEPMNLDVKFGQAFNSVWFDIEDDSYLELYNLMGNRIMSQELTKSTRNSISMLGFDQGIYLFKIVSKAQVMSGKFLYLH
jgi:hypothetical protein